MERGIELLSESGYHGTGLQQILGAVNIPKGSFYNYFQSKEQFVAEVITRYNQKIEEQLDRYLIQTKDDPVTAIRNIHAYMIKLLEKDPKGCLIGNLSAEIGNASNECRIAMQHGMQAWKRRFEKLMQAAQSKRLLRRDVPAATLADILWNTWQGGLLRMKIEGNTMHLKQTLEVLLDVLFR